MRQSQLSRTTLETDVSVSVLIDGSGSAVLEMEPKFMQHMITSMTVHSGFNLTVTARGDLLHHIVEDVALCLGRTIKESLKDINTIVRYGHAIVPMDDSLALVSVDISYRPYSVIDLGVQSGRIEDTAVEDIEHFISSLASSLSATIHVKVLYGMNDHHKVEAVFKGLGIALKQALCIRDEASPPSSSKGVL